MDITDDLDLRPPGLDGWSTPHPSFDDEVPPIDVEVRGTAGPSVEGRRVRLEVPNEETIPALWELAVDPVTGFRWRFHGMQLSPQTFSQLLWEGTSFQFVARTNGTGEPVVYLVAHGLDRANGTISLSLHGWPRWLATPALWEGIFLFVRYLFGTCNVRRIYSEVPEFNLAQFVSGAGALFRVEARLRDRLFYDGMFWDQFIVSVSRDEFGTIEAQFAAHFLPAAA